MPNYGTIYFMTAKRIEVVRANQESEVDIVAEVKKQRKDFKSEDFSRKIEKLKSSGLKFSPATKLNGLLSLDEM